MGQVALPVGRRVDVRGRDACVASEALRAFFFFIPRVLFHVYSHLHFFSEPNDPYHVPRIPESVDHGRTSPGHPYETGLNEHTGWEYDGRKHARWEHAEWEYGRQEHSRQQADHAPGRRLLWPAHQSDRRPLSWSRRGVLTFIYSRHERWHFGLSFLFLLCDICLFCCDCFIYSYNLRRSVRG
jgi:hypothetical protein